MVLGQNTKYDDPDDPEFYEQQQRYDDAEFELLVLMREALSIPEADLTVRIQVPVPFAGFSECISVLPSVVISGGRPSVLP